jgi:hypothetical protein
MSDHLPFSPETKPLPLSALMQLLALAGEKALTYGGPGQQVREAQVDADIERILTLHGRSREDLPELLDQAFDYLMNCVSTSD